MGLEQAKQYQDRAKFLVDNKICCSMGEGRRLASHEIAFNKVLKKHNLTFGENKDEFQCNKENNISNTNR